MLCYFYIPKQINTPFFYKFVFVFMADFILDAQILYAQNR